MKKRKSAKKIKTDNDTGKEIEEFKVGINTFGEIESNMNIDEINDYLNKNLEDKKLKGRSPYRRDKTKSSDGSPGPDRT
jgi:hypothetical protein